MTTNNLQPQQSGDHAPRAATTDAEVEAYRLAATRHIASKRGIITYSPYRHGGWYTNVYYPSGAVGCVSRNYPDGKWRIVCDNRRDNLGEPGDHTYPSREAAALAEARLILATVEAP